MLYYIFKFVYHLVRNHVRGEFFFAKDSKPLCIRQYHILKHIALRHHYIREKVASGEIEIQRVNTTNNLADCLTKGLPRPRLEELIRRMGIKIKPQVQDSEVLESGGVLDKGLKEPLDGNGTTTVPSQTKTGI